ncbi:MAG TPA: PAS domain S-box protein [Blastocatellia bacterium]|nr:PAS domain S-box protein [Blastocatellia bacterium]
MRLPTWKFRNDEQEREESARRLHEAAWPDMFANLQSAYAELTNAQFELERRTAEISETRDLFQQVISSMSEALFLTDRSGRVIRANPAAAALLECAETSILGRPLTAVCGSDDIPATPWKLMEIAPTGRITNLDADLHTLGGSNIPVSFSLSLMHDKQNKITGVLAVARDMREQRSLINSLVAARTRFQELLEFAPDAIVLANQDGEIVLVNTQTERIFGYKRDELLGKSVEILVPERLRGQVPEPTSYKDDALLDLDEVLLTGNLAGGAEQVEFYLLDRDGREFPAEITRRQIETEDGLLVMSLIRDITERKRAENARHAAESRYQDLFDNANDIVYIHDLEGNFKSLNKTAERLTGYSLEESLQMNIAQLVVPKYLPEAQQRIMSHVMGSDNLPPFDLEIIRKDGTLMPIEVSTRLVIENGQPIGVQGIARDITERQRAESAHMAADARYHALFDNANDLIYTHDLQGNFLSVNPMSERITGFTHEEAMQMNIAQIVAPEYLPMVMERVMRQVQGEEFKTPLDLEIVCKDGSRMALEINTRVLVENGMPVGMQGIARDITERKQADLIQARLNRQAGLRAEVSAALTDENNTLPQMLQQCTEAIVENLDAAFARIWLVNEAERVLELQASAGINTQLNDNHSRVPVGEFKIGRIAEEKAPHLTNDVLNDPQMDDKEWAVSEGLNSFAGYPLMVGDRVVGVMAMFSKHKLEADTLNALASVADTIVHGVERKRIEDERKVLLEREHEARMEAETASRLKDDFLAMISHELRAPLTAILGWAQMLRSGTLDRASAERALTTIERNAKSQAHLVGDLLDASRISTGKLSLEGKPVELMSVVDAAVDAVRPSVEAKNLRMQIVMEPWVGPFNGDPERLKQVVWNLLSNAIKFTPAGGLIEVRLERLENKALLIVSDTGQGIDPEFLPHIFDRFRQADSSSKRQQGGLGLGLAIVKHIVELHGGAIYAYSRGEGQGSDFMITLPLAVQKVEAQEGELWPESLPEAQTRSGNLRGIKVLVVDDERDTREVLSVMLNRYGTEVRTAGSVREALEVLSEWKPDMLVSDIGMPEEDGYVMIRKLRALPADQGGQLPAVALTAFASPADKEKSLAAGFQRHLAKPVEPVELAKIVARVLGRSEEGITL